MKMEDRRTKTINPPKRPKIERIIVMEAITILVVVEIILTGMEHLQRRTNRHEVILVRLLGITTTTTTLTPENVTIVEERGIWQRIVPVK